jgi:hypothetical protein
MINLLLFLAFWAPIFALQWYTRNGRAGSDMDI